MSMKMSFLFPLLYCCAFFMSAQETSPYHKTTGLSHPESVVLDNERQVLYVSNMADRTPGDGFISRISPEGEVLDLKWISGLNDPKGLLVKGNKLFTADNTELVEIDIPSGKVVQKKAVAGSGMLNDVAEGNAGELFVSDTRNSSIYRMETSGNVEEWLNSPDLEQPNGLLVDENGIYVAAWGKDQPGNLLKVNGITKEIEKITGQGIGNLDGIQEISENSFYISDWATGKIYKVAVSGEQEEVLTSGKSAGDILFLKDKNELLLPMNQQNELWWYKL